MPWTARDTVSLREEFVRLASVSDGNVAQLCRRFSISRKTGYKWLSLYKQFGAAGLADRSRRPKSSPRLTAEMIEQKVLELRDRHPARGGRTLRKMLQNQGLADVPAPSTITGILRRHGRIDADEAKKHQAWTRFERAAPNELWQMDFKGHVPTDERRVHPLTVLDDHSRYAVGLVACSDERTQTVRASLTAIFQRYGVPQAILCDNGSPWGTAGADERHTALTVWLMDVGVQVLHGRPHHPQTQGKDERFHRTLKSEVLYQRFASVDACQSRFDGWRQDYNWERPHQALKLAVPGSRYRPSRRSYVEPVMGSEAEAADGEVRKVDSCAAISAWGQRWKIGQAFIGRRVVLEPDAQQDGCWRVLYRGMHVKTLDRRSAAQ